MRVREVWGDHYKYEHWATSDVNEWNSSRMDIERKEQISHIFNKASVRDISASEIKMKDSKMIDNLIGKLEESHIHWYLNSKLELDTDYQYYDPPRASKSSDSILHSAILNMKTFPHAKELVIHLNSWGSWEGSFKDLRMIT